MNQCPTCGRLYEANVQFCPTDGAPLEAVAVEPVPAAPVVVAHAAAPAESQKTLPVIFGVLVVAVLGLIALMVWQQQSSASDAVARADAAEADAEVARDDAARERAARAAEAARAEDAVTDAQAVANERDAATSAAQSAAAQARSARAAAQASAQAARPTPGQEPFQGLDTGAANSPADGFLALRSGPSASTTLLARIPNGAAIELGTCRTRDGVVRQREWCHARYDGRVGWVYNQYVMYEDVD